MLNSEHSEVISTLQGSRGRSDAQVQCVLNSAVHNETREIEDLLSDEASSIWPDNDLNVTLSSISTEKLEQTGMKHITCVTRLVANDTIKKIT